MKRYSLSELIFMALCCDLGLFTKRMIAPFTNIITDALHIPGGIGTSFSIMFICVASIVCNKFGSATLMCVIQSGIALGLGMVGSMGLLSPIGYIIPGIVIDILFAISKRIHAPKDISLMVTNALASASASVTANIIIFHLWGIPFLLYIMVAITSGAICGALGGEIIGRLLPAIEHIKGRKRINEIKEN